MNGCELTAGITALANCIAKNLNDDELVLAAIVSTQLGDTLATIAAVRQCKESVDPKTSSKDK